MDETAGVERGAMVEEDGTAVNSTSKVLIKSSTLAIAATLNRYSVVVMAAREWV